MTSYAMRMCDTWNDGSIIDIHKEMMRVTARNHKHDGFGFRY